MKGYFLFASLTTYFSMAIAIYCYKCESYRDFRCLDPFQAQPFPQVNCDYENFVRDRKPVFCEKRTDLIDGVYTTTRGCSTMQWEDVDIYFDHRNQDLRCFRRGSVEQCLCPRDNCNSAMPTSSAIKASALCLTLLTIKLLLH